MMQLPLDAYLSILKTMTPEDHPYKDHPTGADALGEAASAMAQAVAKFVEVGREHLGYDTTRDTLEDLVHMFPTTENPLADPDDPLVALQLALMDAMGRIPDELLEDNEDADK